MAIGRLATPSGNAISAAQERHRGTSGKLRRSTNGKLYLLRLLSRQLKPDVMIGDVTIDAAKTGIVTTGSARTNAACRLRHPGTTTTTRT